MLEKIRKIADYQFGKALGTALFPHNVKIPLSQRTGRIRHISLKGKLLATLRPTDGMLSLTGEGANRLIHTNDAHLQVWVSEEATSFVANGKSVFAKHVIKADKEIRPQSEALVLGEANRLLAVGKAVLAGNEMRLFRKGVAVRVRRGTAEKQT